jgi:hypothetical protein
MTCKVGGHPYFSLRTLKRIKFVHFEMYGEHKHNQVGENRIMHLFNHPDNAFDELFCLDRVPKKLKSLSAMVASILFGPFCSSRDGTSKDLADFLLHFSLGVRLFMFHRLCMATRRLLYCGVYDYIRVFWCKDSSDAAGGINGEVLAVIAVLL